MRRPALLGAAVVAVCWLAGWYARYRFGSPNVDDYLYTSLARSLASAPAGVLDTGPSAPLVPVLAAPLARFGPDVAVLAQLPVLLGLYAACYLLMARRVPESRAALLAAAVCLAPPVLGWSLMVHMALLSAACALAAIEAYLRSAGFTRAWPSVACGVAIALLSLARSVSPVYVAALVAALGVATLLRHGRPRTWRPVLLGAAASAAVAAPWWLVSGRRTVRYLRHAGYDASSGFVSSGNPVAGRVRHVAGEWGLALVLLLVAVAVVAIVRRRGGPTEAGLVLTLFAAFVLLILATSANEGTAFALPALPALLVAAAGVEPAGRLLAWGAGAVAVLGVASAVVPSLPTRPAAPASVYAYFTYGALGTRDAAARSGPLHRDLVRRTGDGTVLVVRDDSLVNVNGLVWEKTDQERGGAVLTSSYDPAAGLPTVGPEVRYVLAGTSCAPYHPPLDDAAFRVLLAERGLRLVSEQRFSTCNTVELWERT